MNFNDAADFWFYQIGVNVISIDSKEKTTYVKWSEFQDGPISEEQYIRWKTEEAFNQGIAIIAGKIWRGKYKGKHLACIDIDNKKGIEEFLSHFGKVDTIDKLAAKTIVEWHKDNPFKVHIYFVVDKPLTKKSGISVYKKDNISNKGEIPAIEVKSEGHHGIMIVAPSIHMNGFAYETLGTKVPTVLNVEQSEALENCINQIYQTYGGGQRNSNGLIPIKDLFKADFKVKEGNNRHEALLRVMESLIKRLSNIYPEEKIKDLAWQYNLNHFEPPLDDKEFDRQWNDAKRFIVKNGSSVEEKLRIDNEEIEYLQDIKQRYVSIFFDQLNRLYVTIKINNHIECIPIDSNRFKFLIRKEILENESKTLNDDKLDRIIKSIQAEMVFDETIEHKELNLRVASNGDIFYYDLTNLKWEIIKIAHDGWEIVKDITIPLFKRYEKNSKPQVYPKKDIDNSKYFKEFLNLFNLRSQKDRLLLEIYLISLFIPGIQKAILVMKGNGGGAKTTTFSLIKNIVDPGTIDTLSFSSNKNDLIQALEHSYVNYFDNVSYISQEVSDTICRAVTGSGDSKRELYTTDGVFVYKFKRCIGINGINVVNTKPDFIDRSLILKVERIPEAKRRKEEEIKKEFERLKPYVLGYIFDVLVKYLRYKEKYKGEVIFKNLPRMADFAESCEIISRCLGYSENAFINAYRENIDNQNDEIIEASPIAESIIIFMENKKQWVGTPTQLYQYLGDIISQVDSNLKRSAFWPKGPNRLTYKINEIIPNLLKRNIEIVTGDKINGQRVITIRRLDSNQTSSRKDSDSNKLSDSFIEPLSNYINPYIHRRGSSDTFECERCPLTGDIHFMKVHFCTKNLTVLSR
ncbi:bifunctional DNA primase/polymerase [Candidatus Nitrosocosmicus sp. FF01]|uniref:bifunctional DNA primase/polymerase n=1 Tax=Candidatus Nitrosocosmicus sp. FF01 TaxID=3397670 RepID=UPI0039EB9F02